MGGKVVLMNENRLVYLAREFPNCGAFEILLKRYHRLFYKSIYTHWPNITADQEPEILSHLYEEFWRGVRNFDLNRKVKFNTYIYRVIMNNRFFEHYFKKEVLSISMPFGKSNPSDQPIPVEVFDQSTEYEKSYEEQGVSAHKDFSPDVEARLDLDRAIGKLKSERRKEFLGYHLSGYGSHEYGKEVGLSLGRGTQIKNETFAQLRKELVEYE
jgi:RNA polymerase sigma factor (sigma-70 family)